MAEPSQNRHGQIRVRPAAASPLDAPISLFYHLRRVPWLIVLICLVLSAIGVGALYSAAAGSWDPWAAAHLKRIGLGLFLMVAIASIPIWYYRKLSILGWGLAVLLLISLEFIGSGKGVQRWISLGGFNLQPSEPAKLAVIMLMAAYFHSINPELLRNLRTYIVAMMIAAIPFALVLLQPDLGTSIMLFGSAAVVVLVAGMPGWMILSAIALVVMAAPVIWTFLYDYQKDRILVFLNPGADQLGAGYQITQSKIALGSGGLFGKGYLQGSQSRLNYLPEKQTDFVFTMIGEEFGFLGGMFILGMYMVMIGLLIRLSMRLHYRFSRLMISGIAAMMFFYVFVNIAMVSGMIPVVGAPLPMISNGGTALLTVFIAIGLVISATVYDEEGAE
jgi:rod shape determining protein RodA